MDGLHGADAAGVGALGELAAELQVETAGHDHRIERRVRNEAVDLAADDDLDVRALLHHAYAAVLEGGIEVPGERVERLVVVVVGVDRAQLIGHGHLHDPARRPLLKMCRYFSAQTWLASPGS